MYIIIDTILYNLLVNVFLNKNVYVKTTLLLLDLTFEENLNLQVFNFLFSRGTFVNLENLPLSFLDAVKASSLPLIFPISVFILLSSSLICSED